jgi:hypothetical protein
MNLKCPFAAPLTKGLAGCRNAQEVVRRGGSEFDCRSEADHDICSRVFEGLKGRALAVFDVEDDLTSMPHSVLIKAQSGGLLGLQRLLGGTAPQGHTPDVADLMGEVVRRFGSPEALPYADLEEDLLSFKLERRGRRS